MYVYINVHAILKCTYILYIICILICFHKFFNKFEVLCINKKKLKKLQFQVIEIKIANAKQSTFLH